MPTNPESSPFTSRTMSYLPRVATDRMTAVMHPDDADMLVLTATRETSELLPASEMTLPQLNPYLIVCVYIYIYVYMYVCMYVYIYMYVCIYIYTWDF